ncbi:MAG: LamG domain-containing protein [Oscillospiraceae bacterium]|nr:LamG domain-containing protein [Oscillospiraceae bacterium]
MSKLRKILATAVAAALCISSLPALAESYDNGLVLYYDFETDAVSPTTIADRSGNGNNATVLNQYGSLTVQNGAAVFSGPSYMDMGSTLLLPDGMNAGITEFTYSAWIDATGSTDGVRFFDFGNRSYTDTVPNGTRTNAYNSIHLEYYPSSGRMRFQDRRIADVYNRNDPKSYVEAYLSDKPFNNGWAMLTVTYGREEGFYVPHIYINGVENKSFSALYTAFTRSLRDLGDLRGDANGLYIGRNRWSEDAFDVGTNPDFTGKMDEIRLYNRTLSADEILSLYRNTRPGTKAGSANMLTTAGAPDFVNKPYGRTVTGSNTICTLEISSSSYSGTLEAALTAENTSTTEVHYVSLIITNYDENDDLISATVKRLKLAPGEKNGRLSLSAGLGSNVEVSVLEDGSPVDILNILH